MPLSGSWRQSILPEYCKASAALGVGLDALPDSSAGPGAAAGPAGPSAGASADDDRDIPEELMEAVTVLASANGATATAARRITARASARAMAGCRCWCSRHERAFDSMCCCYGLSDLTMMRGEADLYVRQ